MTGLRFIFILIILLLILNPVIKNTGTVIQKPVIVFVQDNSKSLILNRDSAYYKTGYKSDVEKLIAELKNKYDVRYLQFSEFTTNDSILNYAGEITDISSVFPEVISRFSGMNLGAVILATDGIYNKGLNPAYNNSINCPVYCIALGDTITQKDLILKDIMHNKIAFLGNRFPLKVYVNAEKCQEKEAEITITRDNKTIYKSKFSLPENASSKTLDIELPADKLGIQQYEISLQHLNSEISYDNNHTTFVINVIDNRNKILLLANAPHPDLGAIKFALKDNPDFELTIAYINDLNVKVKDFDLVILHQLPSIQNKATTILSEIEKNSIPVLYILGSASSLQAFNSLNTGLEITSLSTKTDDATPTFNTSFLSFDPGVDAAVFFKNLSPLKVFFGEYKFTGESKIFLYQSVNGVKTSKPLIAFTEKNKAKYGFITGEGIWRWRIDDYRINTEHSGFNSIINRLVQYLMVRKIQDKLTVETKQVFNENEPVILNSSFYDETYELVPNLEVDLVITDQSGKEFKYIFGNYGNSYRIDAGRLPVGKYSYKASAKFDNRDYSNSGVFIVRKINIEALVTTAGHSILYQLASVTSGQVYYPQTMSKIPENLKSNANISDIAYQRDKLFTLTDLMFIFFVILLFAAVEWSLRKFWGGY